MGSPWQASSGLDNEGDWLRRPIEGPEDGACPPRGDAGGDLRQGPLA